MKIAVFTSNQSRHLALINTLVEIADEVFAIQECNTVFPGQIADFFRKSPVMQNYFRHVIAAERKVFGDIGFARDNMRQLPIKMGDINMVDPALLARALAADAIVVFGASYIKAPLIDLLTPGRPSTFTWAFRLIIAAARATSGRSTTTTRSWSAPPSTC